MKKINWNNQYKNPLAGNKVQVKLTFKDQMKKAPGMNHHQMRGRVRR